MWPFDFFKKISRDPEVGQTRGDYIGCYLLGTETPGLHDASYHSLATTRAALLDDARSFLQGFLQEHPQLPDSEREELQSLLDDLETRVDAHLAGDTRKPLAVQGGTHLFLRPGMRARKKEQGRYLE
ncbi:hypothetical protein [Comamonas endophytica]|uniref:Uncharacterized protein n=1 Tax=Comamonas endophytica TaxID=2949090 RepID=A0ABY6GAK7_9BURK|nr:MULTISPECIES: hypothetical protein [unclassified Acidovorax]MCD2513917.1 hypothetical protein [Acidovorax sp. D4N7]UYG52089.1 hypothetical protein M9799_02250 [Acidovorax sp. 5MLIR]